jgi:hypothetical protein
MHRKVCYLFDMIGRPKVGETRKMVTMPADLAQAVDDYRFKNRIKTEAEALRQLIEAGLKASPASPSGGGDPGPAPRGKLGANRVPKKPAPEHKAEPAAPLSKEAQIRALREQGAR